MSRNLLIHVRFYMAELRHNKSSIQSLQYFLIGWTYHWGSPTQLSSTSYYKDLEATTEWRVRQQTPKKTSTVSHKGLHFWSTECPPKIKSPQLDTIPNTKDINGVR